MIDDLKSMGKSTKTFNGVRFSVVGHRPKKSDAKKLQNKVKKNHLTRLLKGKDARGKSVWLVWASIKKKR